MNQATQQETPASSSQDHVTVSRADLPLYCPMPGASLWNMHPRVFLEIEKTGHARCPYCGTEYTLKD
ncbi:MAG TPA: zinc-finger domain-containing protein [Gammaproteobacteria bacterium]|nr:zinc-finger domain-containing protein [Gammaproteobacteria bacterium]